MSDLSFFNFVLKIKSNLVRSNLESRNRLVDWTLEAGIKVD